LIEVNLLPGGKKRGKRGGGGIGLPDLSDLPADPYILGTAVVSIGVVVVLAWMLMGVSSQQEDVQVSLQDALEDSANFADLIERNQSLEARRDSIAEKVSIIQEIDAGRYMWPHLLDEVARALPDFTWLSNIIQISVGQTIDFEIQGRAGNTFALTKFMENLEASPFMRGVSLINSQQVSEVGASGDQQQVYSFQLEAQWQNPPLDILQTVPLLNPAPVAMPAAADTTGGPDGNEQDG
jgi:Tfp pilus assembly protein PilN